MTSIFASKLNLKPGMKVLLLNDQAGLESDLRNALGNDLFTAPPPTPAPGSPAVGSMDAALLFAANSAELLDQYVAARPVLGEEAMLWVMYPKKSSGVTSDLSREEGWSAITGDGWQGVRQIAINDTWSALRYKKVADANVRGSVDEQYSGPKAGLRPIYDKVAQAIAALGPDVSEGLVRSNYVAWSRKNHFVAVGPVGKTGVGVSFKFKDRPFGGRLTSSNKVGGGGFTHLVTLSSVDEVDEEFLGYLRQAYEASV